MVYIGSTCNFIRRKSRHKRNCCDETRKDYNIPVYKFIRDNGGWYSWEMLKIKDFSCNLKKELEVEERQVMLEYGIDRCLNKVQPTRTIKEYYNDNKYKIAKHIKKYQEKNKDKILEKHKQWCEKNKDKIAEKNKQWYEKNKDKVAEKSKQYREINKDKIAKQKAKYYEINRDKIAEKRKQRYEINKDKLLEKQKETMICECGIELVKRNLNRHKKTKKHIKLMQ